MENVIVNIAIVLVVIIAAVLAYASTKPDEFTTTRATIIEAPAEKIFPLIDSLHGFNKWNPFVMPDPAIKIDYYGPDSGVGAGHKWDGNRHVGSGSIEVTESNPPSHVVFRLHMVKPMKALNRVEFRLTPHDGATNVSWTMQGRQPMIGKVMTLFIDCDKMVGGQFEKGLASLKALAEK